MTTTVEAVYQNGTLKLSSLVALPENSHVLVTIQTEAECSMDRERAAWLRRSEETLRETWDNPDDEVFNELLQK